MLEYKIFGGGFRGSNTYLVWESESRLAMVIDCGNPAMHLLHFVQEKNLTVKYLVLTHGHYDHVNKIAEYCSHFPDADIVSHGEEARVLVDMEANVSTLFRDPSVYPTADIAVAEGDVLSLGKAEFEVLSTPGHTPGSICLYCKSEKLMFTGDTLFAEGWGRTDFKYGDDSQMHKSLTRLLSMDGEILFLSGHGSPSTIAARKSRGIYDF